MAPDHSRQARPDPPTHHERIQHGPAEIRRGAETQRAKHIPGEGFLGQVLRVRSGRGSELRERDAAVLRDVGGVGKGVVRHEGIVVWLVNVRAQRRQEFQAYSRSLETPSTQ